MHITHTDRHTHTHTHIYIYIYPVIIQNKGYAPGLALDRRGASKVSSWWLRGSLLDEDLLFILLNYLLILLLAHSHELYQLVI